MDRTFVMIKPDGVQRGLVGEIVSRLRERASNWWQPVSRCCPRQGSPNRTREHLSKAFFPSLKTYIMGGPCFLMIWEGRNAVAIVRKLIGATNPQEAAPGTIRGDFGIDIGRNVIHASDSPESATREIGIHFKPTEQFAYTRIDESMLYEY